MIEPSLKKILQYPRELEQFMAFMVKNNVRSYLEIGIGSGHLVKFIRDAMQLDRVYACDIRDPGTMEGISFFNGNCYSDEYLTWRRSIGLIDMVFVDSVHTIKHIRADYSREKSFPHRFLAFHDIGHKRYSDLKQFWGNEVPQPKIRFVNNNLRDTLIALRGYNRKALFAYHTKYGRRCGIGVCWSDQSPC